MEKKVNFNDLINGDKPVLVDFFADWCAPCKAMGPILQEVAQDVGDKANIVKVDVDRNPQIAGQLGIRGIPTFILFQKGEIVWRQSGMQSAYALTNIINEYSVHQMIIFKSIE